MVAEAHRLVLKVIVDIAPNHTSHLHRSCDLSGSEPAQSGHVRKGRDGCRVPLPWTAGGPSYGFGAGGAWLPQPRWFASFAVETQAGREGSTLELYRTALRLRRKLLDGETLTWAEAPEGVLHFARSEGWRCVTNVSHAPVPLPPGEVLLVSVPLPHDGTLPPDTTVWLGV